MIPTSAQYQQAVVKNNRSSTSVILFGVFDVTARADAAPTSNSSQPFTAISAIKGEIRNPEYQPATFERDYFRLDGSFHLMPDDVNPAQDIIGWWSQSMSDASGVFAVAPTTTIQFSTVHSSMGLGLFFGTEDYCTEFDVTWYNGLTVLGYSMVNDNAGREYNISNPIENYNKIVIRLLKTRRPYRYARLMEIGFGLEARFDNDDIVSASVVEEVDPSSSVLSVSKLKFTVLNTDQKFNMLNPQGIYAFLQRRQKIVAQSGLRLGEGFYEYIPMGNYYLSEWKNSNGLTATLEATDAIGLLDRTTYTSSPYWVNAPVENVLRHILEDAEQFSLTVSVAAAAETVTGYIPVKSHREALLDVLIASSNVLRMARSGIFEVSKVNYATIVSAIDNETIIGSPTIEQIPLITSVEVKEPSYALNAVATELHKSTFNLVGTQTLVIDFGGKAASNPILTVSGAGAIVGSPIYSAVAVQATITGTGSLTITVMGKEYVESTKSVTSSVSIPAGEVAQTANVADNKLLVGKGAAVATNMLNYYQKRIKQTFNYWCDPAIQSGDCVNVETMFGVSRSGLLERQEISIAPTLKGKLEVVG